MEGVRKVPCLAGGAGGCVKEDGLEVGGGSNVLGFRNSSRPISCSKVFLNSLDTCCHNPSSKDSHVSEEIQAWGICLSQVTLMKDVVQATLLDYLKRIWTAGRSKLLGITGKQKEDDWTKSSLGQTESYIHDLLT